MFLCEILANYSSQLVHKVIFAKNLGGVIKQKRNIKKQNLKRKKLHFKIIGNFRFLLQPEKKCLQNVERTLNFKF